MPESHVLPTVDRMAAAEAGGRPSGRSPPTARRRVPANAGGASAVPDAHDPSKRHTPVMLTTDLALRMDPIYEPISRGFHQNPDEFADAFARAWFKLTHRDMGPIARYLGPEIPAEQLLWQDPVPAVDHELLDEQDAAALKSRILESGPSISQTGLDRLDVCLDVPRQRQARRGQRGAHPPRAAEGL